ncbi:MAG: type I-G CRISPR-associated protein Csb2 [Terriglobia bacterium]
MTPAQCEQLSLISGKDGEGKALVGHHHAYFFVWPDEHGYPLRVVLWRREAPFTWMEIDAVLAASEGPISWGNEQLLYIVPLPFEMPLPPGFGVCARVWRSVTPFVPPAERHRFRANCRLRPGETPEGVARRLLLAAGMPPVSIAIEADEHTRMQLHETRRRRLAKEKARTSFVRPGFRLRLEFDTPVQGPLAIGDSCHFGLGLFRGVEETDR